MKIKEFADYEQKLAKQKKRKEKKMREEELREGRNPKIIGVPRNTLGVANSLDAVANTSKTVNVAQTSGRAYGLPPEIFLSKDEKAHDKEQFESMFKTYKKGLHERSERLKILVDHK